MKLWQKDYSTNAAVEQFTVGRDQEFDLYLAAYDVLGSLAHIQMLSEVGLLDVADYNDLSGSLKALYKDILAGRFSIEPGIEDVHSQVELILTQKWGDKGKRIHSARSRNDQVLVDLKLFFRSEIEAIVQATQGLFEVLMAQSRCYAAVLMPGYTHLQVAMPSSFGLWFGAYAETLCDDLQVLQGIYRVVNQNPLGSAAGYGSSLPINRRRTTALLGFSDLNYNVVHAQMGRGKTEHFLAMGIAGLGHTLAKMSMDICLYINQNFNFISLPPELTTGSSIMPHKKNPDVFELARGKANRLQSLPTEVALLTSNLPSGYHRDFQLLKEILFPAIQELKEVLGMLTFMVDKIVVHTDILNNDLYKYMFSVESVNQLVVAGVPFRDAYKQVGAAIEAGTFEPDKKVVHTHEGSIGQLCHADIEAKMADILRGYAFESVQKAVEALVAE